MQVGTRQLNAYMRDGGTDNASYDKTIQDMKSAISKYGSSEPMTLYRGVNEDEFNYILNHSQTESFKSTSSDIKRADAFGANQGNYIVEYHTSRGTRLADVNGAPGANENEYILDSGNKYTVRKVSDKHIIVNI